VLPKLGQIYHGKSFHFSWVYAIIHVLKSGVLSFETSMSTHETTLCQGTEVCLGSLLRDGLNICKLSLHLLHFYIDYIKKSIFERSPSSRPLHYVWWPPCLRSKMRTSVTPLYSYSFSRRLVNVRVAYNSDICTWIREFKDWWPAYSPFLRGKLHYSGNMVLVS
jgi:hypothetical protein